MTFKIDKDIPAPDRAKYPVRGMEVGDSFFVPSREPSARNSPQTAGRYYGFKLVSRAVVEDGIEGVRIWRTE